MAIDSGKLIIDIDGDTKDVEKAIASTEKSAKQMANQLAAEYRRAGLSQSEAMTKAWKEIEKQGLTSTQKLQVELYKLEKIGSVALSALAAGFAAVGAGLAASVSVGAGFEHQMSAVEAISGATADQMERLTAKAQEMGETSAFTATQAGQAFQFMAQAGWNTEAMLGGIEGIMDLAAASGQDLASTSDIVTDALTAFGLSASESGRFADVLAKASAKSNTDVGKMGYTFKYVAPLAGALKYSIEDTAVAIGLMANAGIKGEQAGTALRGIFTRLVKPTKDSEAAISALGLSITNADGTMKPLSDVILQMRSSFEGLTDEQKATYAAMLGGQEAMSGLLAIVNASDQDFANLTHEINNAAGSAKEMADIRLDNLTGQFTLFMSALEGVGITIYNSLSKPLTDSVRNGTTALGKLNNALKGEVSANIASIGENLGRIFDGFVSGLATALPPILTVLAATLDAIVDVGSTIIDAFVGAVEWTDRLLASFGGLDTVLVALIAGFTTLKAYMVITAAIAAWQSFGGVLALVTKAQLLLNAAMAANPIGLIITAVGALVSAFVYLYQTNEKFRQGFQSVWDAIVSMAEQAFQGLLDVLFNPFIKAYNWLGEAFENIGAGWGAVSTLKGPDFGFAKFSAEAKDLNGEMEQLKKNAESLGTGESTPNPQMGKLNDQINANNAALNVLKTNLATTGGGGGDAKTPTYSGFTQTAEGFFTDDFVGPVIDPQLLRERNKQSAAEFGAGFSEDVSEGISDSWGTIGNGIGSALRQALEGEKSWGDAFADLGMNLIEGLVNGLWDTANSMLTDVLKSIGGYIVKAFSGFMGIASPSKVFADLGYWTMAGYAEGLTDSAKMAMKPLSDLKSSMSGAMSGVDLGALQANLMPSAGLAMAGAGGYSGGVNVSIINKSSANIEQTSASVSYDNQGNMDITATIADAAVGKITQNGSRQEKAISRKFGMKPQPNRR